VRIGCVGCTLVAFAFAVASACRAKRDAYAGQHVLSGFVARFHCPASLAISRGVPSDSLTREERCALVGAALHALAAAHGQGLTEAGDTALISAAFVGPLASADSNGAILRAFWVVTFTVPSHALDDEAWIDRGDGSIAVRHTHKPIGPVP
jgi:hypothetical protein